MSGDCDRPYSRRVFSSSVSSAVPSSLVSLPFSFSFLDVHVVDDSDEVYLGGALLDASAAACAHRRAEDLGVVGDLVVDAVLEPRRPVRSEDVTPAMRVKSRLWQLSQLRFLTPWRRSRRVSS